MSSKNKACGYAYSVHYAVLFQASLIQQPDIMQALDLPLLASRAAFELLWCEYLGFEKMKLHEYTSYMYMVGLYVWNEISEGYLFLLFKSYLAMVAMQA